MAAATDIRALQDSCPSLREDHRADLRLLDGTDSDTDDGDTGDGAADTAAEAGLRPTVVEPAPVNCGMTRPVQASIFVPVETSLGLSDEPVWLDGYGWISAPTCRQLLPGAELRRIFTRAGSGELVDPAERAVRPPPTPTGLRQGLLTMVVGDLELSDVGGPTAAWNLAAHVARAHQHKHLGWTPLRTSTSTLWFQPLRPTGRGPAAREPATRDRRPGPAAPAARSDELHLLDAPQLTPPIDEAPELPHDTDRTTWTTLPADEPIPF